MRQVALCLLLFVAPPAFAQATFPVNERFVVTALNGQNLEGRLPTARAALDPRGHGLRSGGFAGCNNWFGRFDIGADGRIAVSDIAATRMFCGEGRMKVERDFLAALKSATRWRMDGRMLILSGEASTLVLAPDAQNRSR